MNIEYRTYWNAALWRVEHFDGQFVSLRGPIAKGQIGEDFVIVDKKETTGLHSIQYYGSGL